MFGNVYAWSDDQPALVFLLGSAAILAARGQAVRPLVAVFWEPGFPAVDIAPIEKVALERPGVSLVGEAELADLTRSSLLITPYGSAFPKAAWKHILRHLRRGGNWLNLGGVPLAVPVVRERAQWRQEIRQTAYHKALRYHLSRSRFRRAGSLLSGPSRTSGRTPSMLRRFTSCICGLPSTRDNPIRDRHRGHAGRDHAGAALSASTLTASRSPRRSSRSTGWRGLSPAGVGCWPTSRARLFAAIRF